MSPRPLVAVTVPWMWQVVPSLAKMRKWAAVPVASALVSCQVPDLALEPELAAAIQSDGSVIVARTVPLFDAAQLAGGAPVRLSKIGEVPTAVSMGSRRALRAATESCSAARHARRIGGQEPIVGVGELIDDDDFDVVLTLDHVGRGAGLGGGADIDVRGYQGDRAGEQGRGVFDCARQLRQCDPIDRQESLF